MLSGSGPPSSLASQTPLKDLNTQIGFAIPPTVGDVKDDDPSLALLFSQLKSMTLQTAKGTSEISERTEFSFVLHNARVFEGMGAPPLFLSLSLSLSSLDRRYD
jgi:hypothetical protein